MSRNQSWRRWLHGYAPLASGFTATAILLLALAGCAHADVAVEQDLAVRMRDGTLLRADVYRPVRGGPFPVLVFRTPYGKHDAAQDYRIHLKAVERGYAVVLQDVRGRYASGGIFDPYRQEGADGYDTIEWAATQAWSDGRVGTYGLSYPGAVHLSRNLQTGESEAVASTPMAADITIHHDAERPSRLLLPVIRSGP